MQNTDILAGPIIRRAQEDMVAIWLVTKKVFPLQVMVRRAGTEQWIGASIEFTRLTVFPTLHVYMIIATPFDGKKFPTGELLEYSIAQLDDDGNEDHAFFNAIVQQDNLAYKGFQLPSFYLQARGQKLTALYASCRKIHDSKGGSRDAMSFGDDLIFNNAKALPARPAVLCLTGDQIYADDVHDAVFDEVTALARDLEGSTPEEPPGGLSLPGKGKRLEFVEKHARFSSKEAANHLVTLAEYAAMYLMAFNKRNWRGTGFPGEVKGYVDDLVKVRRLMANTPTYMIFDDHDVTDDWNLSVEWKALVYTTVLGKRIIANALCCFWLFQAWGNDPDRYKKANLLESIEDNLDARKSDRFVTFFLGMIPNYEFHTPTYPFIYFLDTRTQRGHRDGWKAKPENTSAPAYLKDSFSWRDTVKRLNELKKQQGSDFLLVLVAPAPVFGFELIDAAQWFLSAPVRLGPNPFDHEGWAANTRHLVLFLSLMGNMDVVLLSGDVHYSYTSTITFSNFDDDFFRAVVSKFPNLTLPKTGTGATPTYQFLYSSRYLQLTSSGAKNFASPVLKKAASFFGESAFFVNNVGKVQSGTFKDGELRILEVPLFGDPVEKVVKLEDAKPGCAFYQRYNDAYNARYLDEHNLGYVTIYNRTVENSFLTSAGRRSTLSWDFGNKIYWQGADASATASTP